MPRKINYAAINPNRVQELEYIDKQLENAGYGYIPRLAILGNVQQESSGNPLAISSNGAWHGIIQWNKDRYRLQNKNAQDELQRQTALLLKELEKTGWSGATWRDQLNYAQSFRDSTDLKQAVDIFTRRFVRPANIESEINKRYGYAQMGWMDEEPEETKLRRLPDNLLPTGNPALLNNQVIDTSTKKGIVVKEQLKPKIVRKSLNEMTEDDVRNLIYNSFKYAEGGSLVYQPFMTDEKQEKYDTSDLDYTPFLDDYLKDSKTVSFPVESVKIYIPKTNTKETVEEPVETSTENPAKTVEFVASTRSVTPGTVSYARRDMNVGNMKEWIDLAAQEGVSFTIYSGVRPNAMTKGENKSNHSVGMALDIGPGKGQTFADLKRQILASPKLLAYMQQHGIGIINETIPEVMAQTGATGPHFHVGPDTWGKEHFERWLRGEKENLHRLNEKLTWYYG